MTFKNGLGINRVKKFQPYMKCSATQLFDNSFIIIQKLYHHKTCVDNYLCFIRLYSMGMARETCLQYDHSAAVEFSPSPRILPFERTFWVSPEGAFSLIKPIWNPLLNKLHSHRKYCIREYYR